MHAAHPGDLYDTDVNAPTRGPALERGFARWSRRWVFAVGFAAVGVVSANLLLDPYQVFNLVELRDSYAPNEIHNKIEHLLTHPGRHDAFFVGSSRMGMFEPAAAQALHPERSFYNLSVLGVEPHEQLAMLQALQAGGVAVRELVIGIDLYPFLTRRAQADPAHTPHRAMSGESRAQFLSRYLFLASYQYGIGRLAHTLAEEPSIDFDFAGTGRYHLRAYDAQRAADLQGYVAKQFPQTESTPRPQGPPVWVQQAFDELAQLRDWCRANGVETYWFIHPLHPSILVNVPDETVAAFRERILALLGPTPDFSEDPRFLSSFDYYDSKHYVPALAERLLAEVLGEHPTTSRAPVTSSVAHPNIGNPL